MVKLSKTTIYILGAVMLIMVSSVSAGTIATFGDPAADENSPLFQIDLASDLITGGWDDSQTNLNLEVIYSGNTFQDAFFTMTGITYNGGLSGGDTGGGTFKFFADNTANPATAAPIIQIDFDSAYVTTSGLGGLDLFRADNVIITGTEIDQLLHEESFAFSFANQVELPSGGFTATAAFTSSASVPEPTTLLMLSLGGLAFWRKRRV